MKRSVERLDGVAQIRFDLNTGRMSVYCKPGRSVGVPALRRAVLAGGFTPGKIETRDTANREPGGS